MKFLGKDIIDFYENGFPENHYMEDCYYDDLGLKDGQDISDLDPTKKYDGDSLGYIFDNDDNSDGVEYQSLLRKWLKSKTTETWVIEFDKNLKTQLLTYLKDLNVKVVK